MDTTKEIWFAKGNIFYMVPANCKIFSIMNTIVWQLYFQYVIIKKNARKIQFYMILSFYYRNVT